MKASAATALALLVVTNGAQAQGFPIRGIGRPAFVVNMVVLPAEGDSTEVEITWEVPLRDLAFQPQDDVHRARYEIAVVFVRGGSQVAGELWERRVRARTIAETRDPQKVSRGRRMLRLPFGRYDARVSVVDRVSGSRSEGTARLDVRGGDSQIGLSDLRLVRYTEGGVERNTGHDVPVGEPGHFVRATLRTKKDVTGNVTLRWRTLAPSGATVANRDTVVALAGPEQDVDLPLPPDGLSVGAHEVEVRLGTTGRAERRQLRFQARLRPQWFAAHRETTIEILRVVADSEELGGLERAGSEAWPDSLQAFWNRRDPTPGAPPNEFLEQLQERLETTCTLFVEPFRQPGWKTDRGRTWLRYGPPDRRTSNAGEIDRPATEVWEYDAPRRVLVFVDRGSGEYWLSG